MKRLRWLLVAGGIALSWLALRQADPREVLEVLGRIGPLAALALLPQALAVTAHALGWRRLLGGLGHRLALARVATIVLVTDAARTTLPAGPAVGEPLAIVLADRRAGVPLVEGAASVAVKKALVMATNALLCVTALAAGAHTLAAVADRLHAGRVLHGLLLGAAVGLGAGSAATLFVVARGTGTRALERLAEGIPAAWLRRRLVPATKALRAAAERCARAVARIGWRPLAPAAGLLFAQWLLESSETWLFARLCGIDLDPGGALVVETCGSLLRSAAFALPGAVGALDAGYATLLCAADPLAGASAAAAFVVLKRLREAVFATAGYTLWLRAPRPIVATVTGV